MTAVFGMVTSTSWAQSSSATAKDLCGSSLNLEKLKKYRPDVYDKVSAVV